MKPEAEHFVAENFDCFELASCRENISEKQTIGAKDLRDTGRNREMTIGGIIFCVGMIGIVISLLMIVLACSRIYIMDPEDIGPIVVCGIALIVSFLFTLFGAIFWLVDWIGERRYWKSFETQDSKLGNIKKS